MTLRTAFFRPEMHGTNRNPDSLTSKMRERRMAAPREERRGAVVLAPRTESVDPELVRDVTRRVIRPALLEAAIQDTTQEVRP
jgi:hypothetical protein